MNIIRILLTLANVLTCFLTQIHGADKYTDEKRPYEFGFRIDGQQHRHEKKDKNGIIMGEFGFITADDVYHVTVYATDEQGRFKILSMKNIHLKGTQTVTSARQGHSLQIPATHQMPITQVITTSTTTQSTNKNSQEFETIPLEEPASSCSHCSLPTTSTVAPKPISRPTANGINTGVSFNNPQSHQQVQIPSSYNTPQNNFGSNTLTSAQNSLSQNNGSPFIKPSEYNLTPSIQNYAQSLEVHNSPVSPENYPPGINGFGQSNSQNAARTGLNSTPQQTNQKQTYPQNLGSSQNYPNQGVNGFGQRNSQSAAGTLLNSTPQQTSGEQTYPQHLGSSQNYPNQGVNGFGQRNSQSPAGTGLNSTPQQTNRKQSYPQNLGSLQNYPNQGINGQEQNYPSESISTRPNSTPQHINGKQRFPPIASEKSNFASSVTPTENLILDKTQKATLSQINNTPQSYIQQSNSQQQYQLNKEIPQSNKFDHLKSFQQNSEEIPQVGYAVGARTPKQFTGESNAVSVARSQKPTLAYAQMQIVDKNTDIYAKAPGEKEGLPQGLSERDMEQLLYTFNYTLGFQGHFEEGYRNGVKQGYYFVTGRNGVRTRVDYTADDKGFHPKITQDVLDLLSDEVPKPETEKQEKYGLKGYEFKWLYYPVDSKSR